MKQETNSTAACAEQFETDGFAVARGLFSRKDVETIRETFMKLAANGPVEGLSETHRPIGNVSHGYDASDPLSFYPRMLQPHTHPELPVGPVAMKYMLHPSLHPLLKAMIGQEPVAVQSMFYFKPPGARGQDLHQDNFYLRVKPDTCTAAWIAIDDADEDNGGMLVVPGTQNMEIVCPQAADRSLYFTDHHVEPPAGMKPVAVKLKAGDVLFFNGSLIHGSYPNASKTRFRRSLICHYVPQNSTELSQWYTTRLRFDGTNVDIAHAEGGGPCGNLQAVAGQH
ncbi:MAG: phytanoyl-CoA dioxygenase family protein [Phycisphaerales bacterium]|jgi:ectoine hydroxylase-related dioxygenase (phytanoyl-CoA dioxygenase family)|nr:phytanoyl-CoA dioxygenase family protein [Phycisphaerales bacterium]